jgi:restriction system protein
MNFLDAAYHILKREGQPLHYTEITQRALAQQLITPKGLTPEATMGSRLYTDTKKPASRFKRIARGYFGLAALSQADGIAHRVQAINQSTRQQLHRLIQEMPASRFEALVGELLLALGFEEASIEVSSYHADGGIDVRGVLNAGGITRINAAVQVKRWKRNIQAPLVQAVRGSLTAHEHGIIITSSNFSKGARLEANAVGKTPISLVSGQDLLELLIEYGIGVNKERHTVISLDEEWWGEMSGSTAVATETVADPGGETVELLVDFPVKVFANHKLDVSAELLNAQGSMIYAGQRYRSPSGAGKEAAGWKSVNGWTFWRFRHPKTGEWQSIQALRERTQRQKD